MKIINGLKFYTFEETFAKMLRSTKFRKGYEEEMARLRLVRQIREIRMAKKMSQRTFAAKIGMPQSVIARLETGRHNISLSTLLQIATAFSKQVKLV
jgi:DNA-binding XRE family transcriptional regulator